MTRHICQGDACGLSGQSVPVRQVSDEGADDAYWRYRQRDRRLLRLMFAGVLLLLVGLGQGFINGTVLSDDLDELDGYDRRSVSSAVQTIVGCSNPLSRLVVLQPIEPGGAITDGFRFRCNLTLLGWPVMTGEARCQEGTWYVPGYMEEDSGGFCGGQEELQRQPAGAGR